MDFLTAAYSDTGTHKRTNEDSLCLRRALLSTGGEIVMAVVCDGMGGLQRGELASAVCVRAFCDWFGHQLERIPAIFREGRVREEWSRVFETTHRRLLAYSAARHVQLGTTAAVFLACEGRYIAANVGDSRVYERGGALRRLTEDHSLVAREMAMGHITEDESRHHPQRNVLLQCLGNGDSVTPFFREGALQNNGLYFLCTDGYVHELSAKELEERLSPFRLNSREQMTEELQAMAEECKIRGETDNITAVLLKASESAVSTESGLRRAWKRLLGKEEKPTTTLVEMSQLLHTEETIP